MIKKMTRVMLLILLCLNLVALARAFNLIRIPGEVSDVEIARESAHTLVKLYRDLMRSSDLEDSQAVGATLSGFVSAVETAKTSDEVANLIGPFSQDVQDIIIQEQSNRWTSTLFDIINQDPSVQNYKGGGALLVISVEDDGFTRRVRIEDKERILTEQTVKRLNESALSGNLSQMAEIEVAGGKATLLTPSTAMDKIRVLNSELEILNSSLNSVSRLSGYAELSGPGVVIRAYDALKGYTWDEIVHDRDIRDIINELAYNGALGIQVGNQRVVVGTSVQCVGPVILVNQHVIAVNPVIIKAVGNSQALEDSLIEISKKFEAFGKKLEVERVDNVVLNPYRKGR